ncbi:putative Major facilitator superfamily domain-containing protein [Seiridium cardinale]|uniref:Major facilitator superfamily domain-containing protein n=1 Tax=Seiridium cardinale TaxID=138064 RepID=A0ABR2XHX7_9PEZI
MAEKEGKPYTGDMTTVPAPSESMSLGDIVVDEETERSYVKKLDRYLLPFLSLMYFFNSVDRSNLGNAQTDGLGADLGFVGNQYSLLILLFYIPNGLCDLPLNMLTKRFSGKAMLPGLMFAWGSMALVQDAAKNFAGLLVIRLLLGAFEAGFFAGTVFYLTLFYTRGELGFRIALYFGSALLASAFSGLISFGVFQIKNTALQGWQWLFIIEGAITVVVAFIGFFWLPASSSTAWFLTESEREVARLRSLRDASRKVDTEFSLRESFQTWTDWKFPIWCIISFTYPVAFSTCANFLPIVLQRLGYSTVVTNLLTVPPNCCGFLVLLAVTYSSDRFRERTYHIVFSLVLSFVGLIILATVDGLTHRGVAYFACFLVASGAYIPSCLVHSWHNNNNLNENSRAANTGLLVGLGNLGGILSAATFRTEYAPRYVPCLVATACCNVVCVVFTLWLGLWMKGENKRRDIQSGVILKPEDVDTRELEDGESDAKWRFFT